MKKAGRIFSRIVLVSLCVCICFSIISADCLSVTRTTYFEETLAQDLKALGLFEGVSDTDFALSRAPTRVEALVMLIRFLGKKDAALNGSWSHPFTDVPVWANGYVGYAYQNGLTNGVSETRFGTGNANAQMYLTFVLRALGYSDTNGLDFTYSNPFTLSRAIGIQPDCVNVSDFWRSDVVLVSYAALAVNLKGSSQTLAQKLVSDGAFSSEAFRAVYDSEAINNYPKATDEKVELNAEQIYTKCSPAVFYIEVADKTGGAYASGSGFFISSNGTAVTNFHVIDGAYSAKITLSSTKKQYDVAGVYDYDEDEDWAIIKIDGSGFSYLDIADATTVVGGARCYTIGSPRGLQSTISEGIISNPAQDLGGMAFIQTTAAISHGSSGGALINKYGQVIGITSAGFEDGENLGFAVPISRINGFSQNQYTALSVLFAGNSANNASSAQVAYDYLIAFVQTYYNDEKSGTLLYSEVETTTTGSVTRRIIYDTMLDMVRVQRVERYQEQEYWTSLTFLPDSYIHNVSYSFYDNPYSTKPAFRAYSYIYAPGFYGNNLEFSGIDTNTGYGVGTNEAIASSDLQDSLAFTDYIFYRFLSSYGDFGVSQFGFINYFLYQ